MRASYAKSCDPHESLLNLLEQVIFVLGSISFAVLLAIMVFLIRRSRRVEASLHVKELLLGAYQEENIQLKRVWEISAEDVKLVKHINKGAYGEVWQGLWDNLKVAVKILNQNMAMLDESVIEEFQKEVDFLQRTRHPNIVRFYGAGQWHSGVPFLVIELVEKGSLRSFLRPEEKGAPMIVWSVKMQLATDIARGMAYIHGLKQIHRDLKSANVLITKGIRAKITDFGTIRRIIKDMSANRKLSTSSTSSRASQVIQDADLTANVGTPLYMAPEMLRGEDYGQSADLWSFGVLFWEIITQRSPDLLKQEGKEKGSIMLNLTALLNEGKRLTMHDSEFAPWTKQIIDLCWQANPSMRPSFRRILILLEGKQTGV